jgi:bacillithiol biosynthesis deacetylase BshB1
MSNPLTDVLAIAAHRDDVEQTCGGTLLKMAALGGQTAILDLTRGESGTRGTVEERAQEAAAAAKLLGVRWRQALDLPDGNVTVTWENKLKVAAVLRELRPRVVIVPYWQARHPDHAAAGVLGYEACFVAGLSKVETTDSKGNKLPPWRPFKILYASLYADVRPSFVVDISDHVEQRLEALLAYTSQYSNQLSGGALFVPQEDIRERTFAMARYYGLLAGVRYGEPFVQKEVGLVDDLRLIPVQSI